ncbi:aminodeoxychorismate/anthranilate synthase component II [Desulfocurvibacter africanus]|uniref:Anthranilate synthase n=1 Tax=Desulfocurvibacter africanus subsp. africanus str. Walvis Bay TaxID=690850 RepID=F3YXN1_DESAF|nr:aminodeoxychorismate/anthranilate synthase component II [Desulfocurvibacter africanus]EGJ49475.1 Anthranilate synthase [Desulfocurvibacter africanus subsp. africanus str. Walvis Bay]
MRILLVDNEDSFTRNLEHLLAVTTGRAPKVLPYALFQTDLTAECDMLVISPGPGHPREYPAYAQLFTSREQGQPDTPVLGVCLGMQIINECLGGRTQRLHGCVHGKAEEIDFLGRRERVARYHSLHVTKLGDGLEALAATDKGVAMALRHRHRPFLGYQFHPESFLTENGEAFIRHALRELL